MSLNLDIVESNLYSLSKSHSDLIDQVTKQNINICTQSIELLRCIHEYFSEWNDQTAENLHIRALHQTCLSARFELFFINSKLNKNSWQYLILTYMIQYFFDHLFKMKPENAPRESNFYALIKNLSIFHFETYSVCFVFY